MKSRLSILLSLLLITSSLITGCSGGSDDDDKPLTYNEWVQQTEEWPDWAEEQQPAGYGIETNTELMMSSYKNSRISHDYTVKAIKEIRYIINNNPDFEHLNLANLYLGVLFERVREDFLSFKLLDGVKQSGQTEAVVDRADGDQDTVNFEKSLQGSFLAIYSRNGFTDKMETTIAEMTSKEDYLPGNDLSRIARAFYVAGMEDEALDRLAIVSDESKYSRGQKMASTTVGAASLAYRMGEYQMVIDLTQWMIDEGYDSPRFRSDLPRYQDPSRAPYYDDQWQSSYKQVEEWRALALENNPVNFSDLKDGDYKITTQGFRDKIDFTVTIADGKLSKTIVDPGHAEDRTYSCLEIIPKKWASQANYIVDGMSGATVTSGAVEIALIKALQAAGTN